MARYGKRKGNGRGGTGGRYQAYGKGIKAARKGVKAAARRAALEVLNTRTAGFIGAEKKFVDSERASTVLTVAWAAINPTGGVTDSISVPSQGDGEEQRDGREYVIKSIHVKGFVTHATEEAQTAPVGDKSVRVVVYWDTQTNAAVATPGLIMDESGPIDILAFRNLQNSKRFIVLYDRLMTFNMNNQTNEGAVNAFAAGERRIYWSFNKSFSKGIKVRCVGTTADVASCSDNNIGLIALASAADDCFLQYQARVRFCG